MGCVQPVNLGHLPDLLTPIRATWEVASEQILSIKLQLQFFKCSCALCSEIWGGKQASNAVIAFDGWVRSAPGSSSSTAADMLTHGE